MKSSIFCIVIILSTICEGCGTKAYLVSETDPSFTPNRTANTFYVFTPDNASIGEKKVIDQLRDALRLQGFNLVHDIAKSNTFVTASLKSRVYESKDTIAVPYTSYTSGNMNSGYGKSATYSATTIEWKPVTVNSSILNHQISLLFYQFKQDQYTGKFKPNLVWSGYLDVEADEFEANRKFFLIKILERFGQEDGRDFSKMYPELYSEPEVIVMWKEYKFTVYPYTAPWSTVGGIYIFAGVNSQGQFVPYYIGQADNFQNKIPSHEQWDKARALGADQVHAMTVGQETLRKQIEKELIQCYRPPLNVQHE